MKKNALEFWVGLFVLLGAAAIGFLAFRAPRPSFGKSSQTYTVYADFSDIGGLKTNAPVKSAGVLVGRVASIQLDPKSYQAKVALNLDSQYQFSSDVSAQILTSACWANNTSACNKAAIPILWRQATPLPSPAPPWFWKTLSANS